MVTYQPATLDLAASFRRAMDSVSRERQYFRFTKAPAMKATLEFLEGLQRKNATQIYALEEGEVVGWCDVDYTDLDGLRHTGKLGLGVIKSHRGRGIGTKLLQLAIEDAYEKGRTRIELDVFASNTNAHALYRKLGFVEEGRQQKARYLDGVYDDFILMALLKEVA